MRTFTYEALPMRVRFGDDSRKQLPEELDALGLKSAVVLTSPEQVELGNAVNEILGTAGRGVYPHAEMHVPRERAEAARDFVAQVGADAVICAGGGSTTGLGKAIAITAGIPIVALPTTYAGSEMTPIWGLTDNAIKRTGRDRRVLPRSVVYDPTLTVGLPVKASIMSGLNAVAHAAEGLYAPDSSPIISMMAEDGISKMLAALPRIASDPEDRIGRSDALYAAWLCGAVLGATTMGLHHKLCHILGGTFNLPHADTHAVVLPYVLAFNLSASPEARAAVQRGVGSAKPAGALRDLAVQLGGPTSLAELGMPSHGISEVVRQAVDAPYSNPRDVTPDALTKLVTEAFEGARPDEQY